MKKYHILTLLLIATLFMLPAMLLVGCKDTEGNDDDTITSDVTEYKMTVTLASDMKEATIAETVTYVNTSKDDLNSLVFYLYPNAYREDALYPAYFAGLSDYGALSVSEITCGDTALSYKLSDSATIMTVALPEALKSNKQITISMLSTLKIPTSSLRLGTAGTVTNITNFFPILSVYEDGAWRQDEYSKVGDPFYSECANYIVTIECPCDVIVACGADDVTETANSYKKTIVAKSENAIDFAFSASKDFKVITANANDVVVNYFYTGTTKPESSLQTAVSTVKSLSEMVGAYPGKIFNLVDTEYYYGGMEYPKIVFINKNATAKQEIIVHETAHQWFGCGVVSDSINNSWQDEALVTFLTNYYHVLQNEPEKYKSLTSLDRATYNAFIRAQTTGTQNKCANMQRSIYDFSTNYEYSMVEYTKGGLMFDALYQLCGDDKLKTALSKYYSTCLHKIATPEDLYTAFESAGIDAKKLCSPWLTDTVVTASFG